jgi:hypothetical protein
MPAVVELAAAASPAAAGVPHSLRNVQPHLSGARQDQRRGSGEGCCAACCACTAAAVTSAMSSCWPADVHAIQMLPQ